MFCEKSLPARVFNLDVETFPHCRIKPRQIPKTCPPIVEIQASFKSVKIASPVIHPLSIYYRQAFKDLDWHNPLHAFWQGMSHASSRSIRITYVWMA